MPDIIESRIVDGFTINISHDQFAESPREWGNAGKILYTSSRYILGDECVSSEYITKLCERTDIIYLPVYAYIHSGIALSTSPFGCRWDSGQCGIIYMTHDTLKHEFGELSEANIKRAYDCLASEIEVYNRYKQGEVYTLSISDSEFSLSGVYEDSFNEVIQELISECKYSMQDQTKYNKAS